MIQSRVRKERFSDEPVVATVIKQYFKEQCFKKISTQNSILCYFYCSPVVQGFLEEKIIGAPSLSFRLQI